MNEWYTIRRGYFWQLRIEERPMSAYARRMLGLSDG